MSTKVSRHKLSAPSAARAQGWAKEQLPGDAAVEPTGTYLQGELRSKTR